MYLQRVLCYPQSGKENELQQHLASWVQTRQSQGGKIGLSLQAFAPEGVVFVLTIRLNDLAELEHLRLRQRTDPVFQEFLTRLAALIRRPTTLELHEALVPLPN